MVECRGVSKSFTTKKKKVTAAKDISFSVSGGRIFGLLGPNGAGKTTTLRMIATLLKPETGSILVNGYDTVKEPRRVRDSIGFLTSDMKLSGNLTPKELIDFFGKLNHMERGDLKRRGEELVSYLGMGPYMDTPVSKCSAGTKQKTSIAVSLIHDPEVVVFDEPTAGLDILSSKVVVDFLFDSKKTGKAVILSTHIMAEAEKLCDSLAIINEGSILERGPLDELLSRHGKKDLEELFFHLVQPRAHENGGISK